jgi:hypothetical protein
LRRPFNAARKPFEKRYHDTTNTRSDSLRHDLPSHGSKSSNTPSWVNSTFFVMPVTMSAKRIGPSQLFVKPLFSTWDYYGRVKDLRASRSKFLDFGREWPMNNSNTKTQSNELTMSMPHWRPSFEGVGLADKWSTTCMKSACVGSSNCQNMEDCKKWV